MAENDSVVAARDLTKHYGEGDAAVNALRGVSIEIAPGTFTAIMGPSGSGKSTLMIKGVGGTILTHAIEPSSVSAVYNFDWQKGSDATLRTLGDDGALLEKDTPHRPTRQGERGSALQTRPRRAGRAPRG
jgi:ABC-type multidrug transport system ATPase subunit